MYEKFFVVTPKSPLHHDYLSWKENSDQVTKFACAFAKRHELPVLISYDNTTFSVILERGKHYSFMAQLKKIPCWTEKGELYDFRKNSIIGKAWIEELKTANLKIEKRPLVLMCFSNPMGRWGWNLFECDKKLYLKTTSENDPNVPDGMIEIKGSDFYKAKEAYEKSIEASKTNS